MTPPPPRRPTHPQAAPGPTAPERPVPHPHPPPATPPFTLPEQRVLAGIAHGLYTPEIADRERLPFPYVRACTQALRHALGGRNHAAMVHRAYLTGALPPPAPDPAPVRPCPGQRLLLPHIAAGDDVEEMSTALGCPVTAVRRDARALLAVLGAVNAPHAVTRAHQLRLLPGPAPDRP